MKHRSGVRAGLRVRYLGERPAFDETSPEYLYFTSKTRSGKPNPDYDPSRVTAQGYTILDAYVSYRWRFLEASLAVQNLLDAGWREAQFGNRSCTETGKSREDARARCQSRNAFCWVADAR